MYDTLGDREIRVFKLHPGQFEDEIRCDLNKFRLSENENENGNPEYDAISHEIGDLNDTAHILCSENQLEIPQSLYTALKYLRSPTDIKTFWAAAICINQGSNEEKSMQVRQIGLIYGQAKVTWIWIGENSDDIHNAVADLPDWLNDTLVPLPAGLRHPQSGINVQVPRDSFFFTIDNTTQASQEVQTWIDEHEENLTRMVKFMSRRWWTRLWLLQEMNSSKAPVLLCGSLQVPLVFLLMGFATRLAPNVYNSVTVVLLKSLKVRGDHEALKTVETGLASLIHFLQLNLDYTRKRGPLQKLLHDTRELECSDPRDRLFSLLKHAEEMIDQNGSLLDIDYSASPETVSKNLSLWFIQHSKHPLWHFGRISRLRNYANSSSADDLPSWVFKLVSRSDKDEPDLAYPLSDYEYDAGLVSEHPRPIWKLSSDGNILSLKGRFIDVLELPDSEPIVNSWRLERTRQYYDTLVWKVAFYLALFEPTAGRGEYQRQRVIELMTLGRRDVDERGWISYISWAEKIRTGRTQLPIHPRSVIWSRPAAEAVRAAVDQATDRKFGITQGMVGWFPRAAEKGDKICVFYGGRVPYVVRPKGESYELIGECWIMDKMDGQGLGGDATEDLYIPLC